MPIGDGMALCQHDDGIGKIWCSQLGLSQADGGERLQQGAIGPYERLATSADVAGVRQCERGCLVVLCC